MLLLARCCIHRRLCFEFKNISHVVTMLMEVNMLPYTKLCNLYAKSQFFTIDYKFQVLSVTTVFVVVFLSVFRRVTTILSIYLFCCFC